MERVVVVLLSLDGCMVPDSPENTHGVIVALWRVNAPT